MNESGGQSRRVVLLVLAVHPPSMAATRLRAVQYAPFLAEASVDVVLWTFLRQSDLRAWYGRSNVRRLVTVVQALPRITGALRAVRRADVVLVQREALPFGPPMIESYAARRRPLVWDVDDAVWQQHKALTAGRVPRWVRATGDKFARLCRLATEVWAGSEVIAEWCRRLNPEVVVIPTVVDVPEQPVASSEERAVGWIGSHSTAPFLEDVLPSVARVARPPEVVVVGGAMADVPAPLRARQLEWTPEAEEQALRHMRVGLYPIDRDHPMADGKCGLKAVLYMAHGVPPVVTPTPTNAQIVRDGVDGLYADSDEEWVSAVSRLLDDDELWARCSAAAHARAKASYSTGVWGPRVAARVRALAEAAG